MTVVGWIDLFTRPEYKDVIVDSLNFCAKEKGLIIYAWVLMTNHLHLICRCESPHLLSNTLRDFKRHTSISLSRLIQQIPESRKEWMVELFHKEAIRINRARNFKIWKDDNHAIWLGDIDIWEKIHYVHENPVVAQIVNKAEDYMYSSARDYCGMKGMVNITKVDDE